MEGEEGLPQGGAEGAAVGPGSEGIGSLLGRLLESCKDHLKVWGSMTSDICWKYVYYIQVLLKCHYTGVLSNQFAEYYRKLNGLVNVCAYVW